MYNNSENNTENSANKEETDNTPIRHTPKYKCRICNKLYSNVKRRWSHERVCDRYSDKTEQRMNYVKIKLKRQ